MEKLSLQENQKIAVGILDAVSKVCDEQGYRYYLVFGTLMLLLLAWYIYA